MHELGDAVAAPDGTVIVTGYRACSAGYPDWQQRPSLKMLFGSMLMLNPPQHTRLRRLVSRAFTPSRRGNA